MILAVPLDCANDSVDSCLTLEDNAIMFDSASLTRWLLTLSLVSVGAPEAWERAVGGPQLGPVSVGSQETYARPR